jgi:hypothetical protein
LTASEESKLDNNNNSSSSNNVMMVPFNTNPDEHAARSYRAMMMLKQDLSMSMMAPSLLIKSPAQAGLLAKDLLLGLSNVSSLQATQRYSTFHIRELLDALLEAFPEKVLAAAAAGGKQGVQDHLEPLLTSELTLSILTHLVCFGCTGRKGIASAEKSAQHTAMYHHLQSGDKSKISLGQRRKFVKAMSDFQLMERLAQALTSTATSNTTASIDAGEEICETILTILEVVGYPPAEPQQQGQQQQQQQQATKKADKDEVMVGEDVLLAPLATPEWWKPLLEVLQQPTCSMQQKEAIARICTQAFALATGNSSRICKSHAPATDATEETSEEIVQEKEETITNRLVEWGLTDKIHAALVTQLPLMVQALCLPDRGILDYQATASTTTTPSDDQTSNDSGESPTIRHPGRYQTIPLGSWRLQLLKLFKEVLTYRGKGDGDQSAPSCLAMDAIMELPLPLEIQKPQKGKKNLEETKEESSESATTPTIIYNPWPALVSFVWAYPNNDFYHIIFFEMLQSLVLEHHEATLRLILQKSKFLTRAVRSLTTPGPLQGISMNCLNLLRLRSGSLPPSAFLHQYLGSHDGWKGNIDQLML